MDRQTDMPDLMDRWTCLIWWTYRHAWFDTNHSPERYIDASFLYVYLHSDYNQGRRGGDVQDVLGRPWCWTVNDIGLRIDTKTLKYSFKNSKDMIKHQKNCLFFYISSYSYFLQLYYNVIVSILSLTSFTVQHQGRPRTSRTSLPHAPVLISEKRTYSRKMR